MVSSPGRHASSIVALMFVAGLILGGIVTAFVLYGQISVLNTKLSNVENQISSLNVNQTAYYQNFNVYMNQTDYSVIYDEVKDSVVVITGTANGGTIEGSGFVYNLTGSMVVVTNNHVVSGATGVSVTFSDGNGYAARVNGMDPYSDLAVLTLPTAPQSEFKPLVVLSSSSLKVGDEVIAIGNPYGLTGSMTTGIVSALGRTITESNTPGGYAIADIIQTSTPINPGNSGGPLLTLNGTVVGITTAIVTNSQGLGFAVPSETIVKEVPILAAVGSFNLHSYLGVEGSDMDYDTAQSMKVSVTYGWLIGSVIAGGPASQAKPTAVHTNDIIIALNATRVINGDALMSWIEQNTVPGDTIMLTVVRASQTLQLTVKLGTRPPP
ncbi:MAG: trypsin-like peptidase domain-containing protein [Candidatus Bathyarchaeia archaeon]